MILGCRWEPRQWGSMNLGLLIYLLMPAEREERHAPPMGNLPYTPHMHMRVRGDGPSKQLDLVGFGLHDQVHLLSWVIPHRFHEQTSKLMKLLSLRESRRGTSRLRGFEVPWFPNLQNGGKQIRKGGKQGTKERGEKEIRKEGTMKRWRDGDGKMENGKMERWRDGKMERWRDGKMERWRDGEMERWKDGKMERWKDGKMVRW